MAYILNRTSTHPGEILKDDFLLPMGLSQTDLSAKLGVEYRTVNEIINGKRSITANTALRLGKFFNMSPEVWLNLQAQYDISVMRKKIEKELDKIVTKTAI